MPASVVPVSAATSRSGGRVWAARAAARPGSQRAPSWVTTTAVTAAGTGATGDSSAGRVGAAVGIGP